MLDVTAFSFLSPLVHGMLVTEARFFLIILFFSFRRIIRVFILFEK